MTSIFVTHDQTEAMTLADRIVCLDGGLISQVGTPDELYNAPRNIFVATFIGSPQINLLEAELRDGNLRLADGQQLMMAERETKNGLIQRVLVGIRPEDLTDASRITGVKHAQKLVMSFVVAETLGSDTYLIGEIAGTRVTARCAPGTNPRPGERITVNANAAKFHLFDPDTQQRI